MLGDGFVPVKTKNDKLLEKQHNTVNADIQKIKEALAKGVDQEQLLELHRTLDGRYQVAIKDWEKGMYNCNLRLGFDYDYIDEDTLIHNLQLMKAKLEGFILGFNGVNAESENKPNDVNVTVNNTVNITISFEEAKQKIDEMPGLTDEDTENIKSKIDELEDISKENINRKKKWEKVKPILLFALDKGVDVAITIMGLVVQMKLGI